MLPQQIQQTENYFPQQLQPFHQSPQNTTDPLNFESTQPAQSVPQVLPQSPKNELIQEIKQQVKTQSPFQISHNQQPPSSKAHFHQEIFQQKNKEAIEELQDQMNSFQKLKDSNQICKNLSLQEFIKVKFDQNQNYFEESCKLFIRNAMMSQKIKEALTEKNEIVNKIGEFVEKENESLQTNEGNQNSEKKKRFRRSAIDITRHYKCPAPKCDKSYGQITANYSFVYRSEGSLSQHVKLKHPDYQGPTKQHSKSGENEIENERQSEQQLENLQENIQNFEKEEKQSEQIQPIQCQKENG